MSYEKRVAQLEPYSDEKLRQYFGARYEREFNSDDVREELLSHEVAIGLVAPRPQPEPLPTPDLPPVQEEVVQETMQPATDFGGFEAAVLQRLDRIVELLGGTVTKPSAPEVITFPEVNEDEQEIEMYGVSMEYLEHLVTTKDLAKLRVLATEAKVDKKYIERSGARGLAEALKTKIRQDALDMNGYVEQ